MGLGGILLTYMAFAAAAQAPATPRARATLADVAFMAGHWRGGSAGEVSEEIWTAPEGDGMLGMWRYVGGGKARVFELLSIRQEAEGLMLRFRHFDGVLTAREEKDTPIAIPLVRWSAGEAVFEGKSVAGGLLRLTYRRDGDDGLLATLEKDGEKPQPFRFERAGSGSPSKP